MNEVPDNRATAALPHDGARDRASWLSEYGPRVFWAAWLLLFAMGYQGLFHTQFDLSASLPGGEYARVEPVGFPGLFLVREVYWRPYAADPDERVKYVWRVWPLALNVLWWGGVGALGWWLLGIAQRGFVFRLREIFFITLLCAWILAGFPLAKRAGAGLELFLRQWFHTVVEQLIGV